MQGRTLLKWRSSPSGDLSDCAKELFIAAIGHYKLVRTCDWATAIASRGKAVVGEVRVRAVLGLRRVHWSKEASSLGCGNPIVDNPRDQTQCTLDDRYNDGNDHQAMVLLRRRE